MKRTYESHPWLAAAATVYLVLSMVEVVRSRLVNARPARATGVYDWETAPASDQTTRTVRYRWSDGAARILEPVANAVVEIPLLVRPDLAGGPVRVTVTLGGRRVDRLVFSDSGWTRVRYYVPPLMGPAAWANVQAARQIATGWSTTASAAAAAGSGAAVGVAEGSEHGPGPSGDGRAGSEVPSGERRGGWFADWRELRNWHGDPRPPSLLLGLEASPTFVPARAGDSRDWRRLGVGVGEPVWEARLPPAGSGLHDWETDRGGKRIRWTRQFASLPLARRGKELRLELRALHPDITTHNVGVEVFWSARRMLALTLDNPDWVDVRLPVDSDREGSGVLSIWVDRTWNPAEWGVSTDMRELGVAITGIEWRQ